MPVNHRQMLKSLKKEVRTSTNALLIGVDIGKKRHCACFLNSQGTLLCKRFPITNDLSGFTDLEKEIFKRSNPFEKVYIALEPTGPYWKPLALFLTKLQYPVVLVSPLAVRRNRETIDTSMDKSDPKDAFNIADLLRQGKFHLTNLRTGLYGDLRRLNNLYCRLVEQRARVRIRLRTLLATSFPELEKAFKNITCKTMIALLEQYPLPRRIASLSLPQFTDFIKQASNHRLGRKKAEEIYSLAQSTIGIPGEETSILLELELLLEEWKRTLAGIHRVQSMTHLLLKDKPEYHLLQTIHGIGPITASAIIAEIGDISYFVSGKQLVKLAGLDLYSAQSGMSLHTQKHITKRGRKNLRTIMYQAAITLVRVNPVFRKRYKELLDRQPGKKKIKPKALIAIASKLLRVVFRMLCDRVAFDPQYDGKLRARLETAKSNSRLRSVAA